jgi:hypothetical protein
MPCNAFYTRFIFLESFHIYYNLICIFICTPICTNFILEKKVGVTDGDLQIGFVAAGKLLSWWSALSPEVSDPASPDSLYLCLSCAVITRLT